MFTAISVFCTIYYHVLKGSMNFILCWEPILKIPILDITLFSFWRISGTLPAHMAELMGSTGDEAVSNAKGFNILTGLVLFLLTTLMSKYVEKASEFGAKLFEQKGSMPQQVKQIANKVKKGTTDLAKKGVGAGLKGMKKLGGKLVDSFADDKWGGGGGEKRQ